MTDTPNLGLPFIEGSQAQKHVTHNAALRILDAAIQIAVLDLSRTAPPSSPAEGQRHVVASGATGAWTGHANAIATWQDGAWTFLTPKTGWCIWSVADNVEFVFDGVHWRDLRDLPVTLDNAVHIGINTTASSPNLLSVKSNAALLSAITAANGGSGDARLQISKESAAKTASVFFSDNFSGRAEFGLVGDDNFHLKVSPDGSAWSDALVIDKTTGKITLLGFSSPAASRTLLSAAPFDALAYNGMQINGGVDVSQELAAAGATLASGTAKYIADCVQAQYVHGAGTAAVTSVQLPAASFPSALSGYSNAHQLKATTALTSLANGDYALHRWIIEGYRIARLGFGAAGAQSLSYGIQVYATVAGTAFLKFSNSGYGRCYYQEQAVTAGWNWLIGTIPGDTTGTWQAASAVGMYVEFFAAGKAASPVSPGAWGTTSTTQTTNATNLLGTSNNRTICTGLILLPGTEVPSSARAPFITRPYDQEVLLCKRYFSISEASMRAKAAAASDIFETGLSWPVEMRVAPMVSVGAPGLALNLAATYPQINGATAKSARFGISAAAAGDMYALFTPVAADARL